MHEIPSAKKMMAAAEADTGLSDWGPAHFRPIFELLVDDINTHAELHELGARRTERRLGDNLRSRLKVFGDRKRYPEIAREKIEKPIFVTGLPRAGTTFFHNLMSVDPANRAPMTWEIMYPSPPPEEATYSSDPRIAQAREAMHFEGFMEPELQSIHPFEAERPEECNFIWELSVICVNYATWWNVPNYEKEIFSKSLVRVYEEEMWVLQNLQHRFKRDRWVLKTPAHMSWIDDLIEVFPDARFVQCHRDPAKILPSLSNNFAAWRRTFSDMVPPGDFGMMERQAKGLRNTSAFRRRPGMQERFFDAHYVDVQRDPIATLRRCYDVLNIDLTSQREQAIRAWMEADRAVHASGARHTYDLKSFGLDLAKIDAIYDDYFTEFAVHKER